MKKFIGGILLVILLLSFTLTSAKADIPSFEGLTPEELREARDLLNQMLAALPIDDSEIVTETSRKAPARIGQIIECAADSWEYGEYKYQVQLTGIIRGEEALEQIKALNSFNQSIEPSSPDKEFILISYNIKILETNESDPQIYISALNATQAVSADGATYDSFSKMVMDLKGSCELYEGGSDTISVVCEVNKDDAPNVLFSKDKSEAWISLSIPE